MNFSLAQYLGFAVAALILIWAVIVINRRYFSRGRSDSQTLTPWVSLDVQRTDETEQAFPVAGEEDQEERDERDLQMRAKQNGHYSESKKPLS